MGEPKYEYRVERIHALDLGIADAVNAIAAEGWRLHSLVADADGMNWWTAVFEREVQS